MSERVVVVSPDGTLRWIWDDAFAGLADAGRAQVRRASHVEPTPDARWSADLAPSGGPMLGPFRLHGEAVEAEREWLVENELKAGE